MGNTFDEFYSAIDTIIQHLHADLIGPVEEKEILIREAPLDQYVCGILWPKRSSEQQYTDIDDLEDAHHSPSDNISSSNVYKPSSMAISVMVPADALELCAQFAYAKYTHKEDIEQYISKDEYQQPISKEISVPQYTRHPFSKFFTIGISNKLGVLHDQVHDDFTVQYTTRRIFKNGDRLVTVAIINHAVTSQKNIPLNTAALFQCHLTLNLKSKYFLPLYAEDTQHLNEEDLLNHMLYSQVHNYAYGHGCSVSYDDSTRLVHTIESTFLPSCEVPQMMPNHLQHDAFLVMHNYKITPKDIMLSNMRQFLSEYRAWLTNQTTLAASLPSHTKAAQLSLSRIELCIKRIATGIDALENPIVYQAFTLMNEAMCLQRTKSKTNVQPSEVKWYPFQLAYILAILPDMVSPDSPFRDAVDLLWFPTGGGKTEAYLGVAAFTIFYRRLTHTSQDDGVAILMRYTLRLLTIQQFERATALICACEVLRRQHNLSGGEINIGLWIGSNMTPNSRADADTILRKLRENKNEKILEGNPVQVTTCPWCKTELDISAYTIGNTLEIKCPNAHCDFHNGLPIYLVDEDVYAVRPTLVLSTADKFARIVWEPQSSRLFGTADEPSIDLIIQDELHLISGPLGSIAGIYELAVSRLCERKGIGAKVIASTATVCNASTQIKNLYNKQSIQFPPNGISAEDSFFAIKADRTQRPARRYIGTCESGGSVADLLIRIYANLSYTKLLFHKMGIDEKIIDQYYSTVGYFNAIKDLGASSSIISDRVKVSLRSLIQHKFKDTSQRVGITVEDIPLYSRHDELTSRKSAKEIKDTLTCLECSYPSKYCFDYILASNMLSVGIDINRLGVMSVYNQPKSNSEYIQATSRVGRSHPGLVIVMYNTMRSRDKSHYEQFPFYHKTMYQYVEATSVTPFSLRAMEKALHCSFTAMVRHLIPKMNGNTSAVNFRCDMDSVSAIRNYMLDVISTINPSVTEDAAFYLDVYATTWEKLAKENPSSFTYTDWKGGASLLHSAENAGNIGVPSTLNALRNVEDSSNVYILRRDW